jgi:formylglycine-generating enzyme required for sulfatase activity
VHEADATKSCCVPVNPRGPAVEGSYNRRQLRVRIPRKVVKGGSHLYARSYSRPYRPAARQPQMVDSAMNHLGFRCILRDEQHGG